LVPAPIAVVLHPADKHDYFLLPNSRISIVHRCVTHLYLCNSNQQERHQHFGHTH
jgi:hypothetical protein